SAPAARVSKAPTALPAATTAMATSGETKKRVTVQMPALEADDTSHEPSHNPILARRALVRANAPRRIAIAGGVLIAAVTLALGWPLVRALHRAPVVSERTSSPPTAVAMRVGDPVVAEAAGEEERAPALANASAAPTTLPSDVG